MLAAMLKPLHEIRLWRVYLSARWFSLIGIKEVLQEVSNQLMMHMFYFQLPSGTEVND